MAVTKRLQIIPEPIIRLNAHILLIDTSETTVSSTFIHQVR